MCDPTPVRNWLLAVLAAIISAIACIVAAAVANGSIWQAWQSSIWMIVAAASTGLATFLCGQALSVLDTFCRCTGVRCVGACSNMRNTINAVRVVLGIQMTACLMAAAQAWIPFVGQALMYPILAALFIQLVLIASAIVFYRQLEDCARPPIDPGGGPSPTGPLPS